MNYTEAVNYLLTLGRELASPSQTRATKFDLNNIRMLAAGMGDPQARFRSVHIAGTNGKGSTAAMLDAILRSAGYRTGLYTSPHLERINERIHVNGAEIGDAEFAAAFGRLHAAIEKMLSTGELAAHPTFFECVTAMAFDVFAREAVEFAVLEVGMGGRLDATNLVTPEVCAITQIAFDHESFLGHSIEQIAGEKAGIIKTGVPVVSAAENPEARAVIQRKAEELGAPIVEIDAEYRVKVTACESGFYDAAVSDLAGRTLISLRPGLAGRFQVRNAVAAFAAARILAERGFRRIDERAIAEGIAGVHWPGRLERLQELPVVYLDGAHNPAGARELASFWEENFPGRRIFLVYGAVRDKAVDEVAGILFPRAAKVFITAAHQPRAISAEALAEMTAHLATSVEVVPDAAAALERALTVAEPADAIFGTGSLYLVGDLRRWWHSRSNTVKRE
jgi:dihydrofolate synthase/folylpolyglutamate synthase